MNQALLDRLKPLNIPVLDAPIKCVISKSSELTANWLFYCILIKILYLKPRRLLKK